jgi:GNAT superfamily N-acetyltransferase
MIRPLADDDVDLRAAARLMAASPLLARYRVSFDAALASLRAALAAGDALLGADQPLRGFAWVSFAPRILDNAAYLRLLLVTESEHGHGRGSALLAQVEELSRARGARHLYLLATTDNAAARAFYEHRDFRHVGDLPGLVWPDLDEALYHKRLS